MCKYVCVYVYVCMCAFIHGEQGGERDLVALWSQACILLPWCLPGWLSVLKVILSSMDLEEDIIVSLASRKPKDGEQPERFQLQLEKLPYIFVGTCVRACCFCRQSVCGMLCTSRVYIQCVSLECMLSLKCVSTNVLFVLNT
jgi:uncharacterized membrane protein YhdT